MLKGIYYFQCGVYPFNFFSFSSLASCDIGLARASKNRSSLSSTHLKWFDWWLLFSLCTHVLKNIYYFHCGVSLFYCFAAPMISSSIGLGCLAVNCLFAILTSTQKFFSSFFLVITTKGETNGIGPSSISMIASSSMLMIPLTSCFLMWNSVCF